MFTSNNTTISYIYSFFIYYECAVCHILIKRILLLLRQHRNVNFYQSAGKGNPLKRLWPTRYKALYHTLQSYNVTQFTVKHASYKNTTTGHQLVGITCLIITLAPSPTQSQPIPYSMLN